MSSIIGFDYPLLPGYPAYQYTPVIPKLYWEVKSPEQRIKMLCCELYKLIGYSNDQTHQINKNTEAIEELDNILQKFMESGFNDYYEAQVKEWVAENLEFVYTQVAKQVFFGLNKQGYFVAYIPESWNEIEFDTGQVYGQDDYGCLILRYNVAADYETVDQTREASKNGVISNG